MNGGRPSVSGRPGAWVPLNPALMLARYMLSSCVSPSVRPSVRHKPVLCRNDWTDRAGFGMGASLDIS